MRYWLRSRVLLSLLVVALPVTLCAATNIVSRPVGFVRVSIPENGKSLVSIPFKPFDSSIDSVLAGQLTGSANEESADTVFKWDTTILRYDLAVKAADGKWLFDFQKLIPSGMTLNPGEGFFIWNRQSATQDVFLAGEVVLDATNNAILQPSFNLVGYPYSSSTKMRSPETALLITNELGMTEGAWFNNTSMVETVWMETRPYPDVFAAEGEKPDISSIQVKGGKYIVLTIEPAGVEGEKLDIYYKDVESDGRFQSDSNWQTAEKDISVKGSGSIEWEDKDWAKTGTVSNNMKSPISAGRYYLVGRADIDSDGDGVPDARQRFVLGKNISVPIPILPVTETPQVVVATQSGPSTNLLTTTNATPVVLNAFPVIGRIIYVDRRIGRDDLSGKSPVVVGADGPKKTIKSGLTEAGNDCNRMLVKAGSYCEDLNIAGRNVTVYFEGKVNLSGKLQPQGAEVPQVIFETNVVNAVTNR